MDLTEQLVERVLIKLGKLLMKEVKLQTGLRKKITCLSDDLRSMHTALCKVADVPPDQVDDQVKLWAREVRDLSYDVEDTLDIFLVRVEGHESRDPNRFKHAAKKIGKLFNKSKARHELDGMIKIINKRAEEIHSRRVKYKVDNIVAKRSPTSNVDPRLAAMYVKVSQLVGIEKSSVELIDKLSLSQGDEASNMRMKIVSLVGIGGLGKTTLARAVYDNLKPRFSCGAFVSIGRNRDSIKDVFVDILIDLDKGKYKDLRHGALNDKQLIDELREFLGSKRYLNVIDDIWETECWEVIKLALVENNRGSRIITTTRIADVGQLADEVYNLERLSCDKSKQLFYTRIFGEAKCPDNQTDIVSNNILKKCDGVPLAIITMASLLVGKSREQWLKLCKSIGFRDTNWILSLSYYDLPPHLKTCLLYLSVFPEDYLIQKNSLIWKWVAEGFIDKDEGIGFFEVAEGYFSDLINRSMIQAVSYSEDNTVYGCRVHDMVLDLLRHIAQDDNFVTVSNNDGTISPSGSVRRLAHHYRTVEPTHDEHHVGLLSHLRSLIACSCDYRVFPLSRFRLLRVLALEYCKAREGFIHLEHLESLLHLRYLRLTGTDINELPKGIGLLKSLQTLDVNDSSIKEVPSSVGQLTQLIRLRAGMAKVPNGVIKKLRSLEDLEIHAYEDTTGQFVKELGNLCELRVLFVELDVTAEANMQSDFVQSLGNLRKIQILQTNGNSSDIDGPLWDTLVLSPTLKTLILHIEFPTLPSSCFSPSGLPELSHLELCVEYMDAEDLQILGCLPELRHLGISTYNNVTLDIQDADCCFQKLRSLSLPCSMVRFALNEDSKRFIYYWGCTG